MANTCVFVRFFGRVQGVGMRMFVLFEAKKRKINGWVMNTPRRDLVEATFFGEEKEVYALIEYIKSGVSWLRIDSAVVEEIKTGEEFKEFEIRY